MNVLRKVITVIVYSLWVILASVIMGHFGYGIGIVIVVFVVATMLLDTIFDYWLGKMK